jgi:hypothetical protein
VVDSRVYAQSKYFHRTQVMDTTIWRGHGVFCGDGVSYVCSDSMEGSTAGLNVLAGV